MMASAVMSAASAAIQLLVQVLAADAALDDSRFVVAILDVFFDRARKEDMSL